MKMKLTDLKINRIYVLRDGDDATLYELLGIDELDVAIKELGSRVSSAWTVDYSLLREPTKRQLENRG